MNRWTTKGTAHAKRGMQELRDRKARLATTRAAQDWCARHGVAWDRGWLASAIVAGYPHASGLTEQQKHEWFKRS